MRYLFFTVLLLISFRGFAQTGNYFLSHYSPGQDRLDNVCFQIAQHENGMMYFATRSGIMQFDGRNWSLIEGNGSVYTIFITKGQIFWGGVNGFGEIFFNAQGIPETRKLSESAKNIFQSAFLTDELYLINDESVFVIGVNNRIVETISTGHVAGSLTGIFEIAGSIYVTSSDGNLFKIVNRDLVLTSLVQPSPGTIVFSSSQQGKHLIGFSNNEIYYLDRTKNFRKLILEDQEYIDRSVIVNGNWVSNDLIVLGTLRGGLVFVNLGNGKTYEIVNNAKGLPDNEIFSLFTDQSQSIWAAHEFGYTRVVPYLPFRSFNHYSGLQGNLLCAITFQNSVYVGTSLGLFKLQKENVYEEIQYYVYGSSSEKGRLNDVNEVPSEPSSSDSKRKGLFGLFKRKQPVSENEKAEMNAENNPKVKDAKQKILKTEKVLRYSNYVYQKVKGIEAKVTQLVEVKGKLIAAGLSGTFEIDGLDSKILVDAPSRYLYGTSDGILFVSTYSDKLHVLKHTGRKWEADDLAANFNDQISHIFEAPDGAVWLCSLDKIFQATIRSGELADIKSIPIDNPNYDQLVGVAFNGVTVVANSNGFYAYAGGTKAFQKIDSLSQDELTNYFSHGNNLWYKDHHGWKILGNGGVSRNPGLLNLFKNIRFLMPDKKTGDLWIITGNNELFKFFNDRLTPFSAAFPLMLKSVRNGELKNGGARLDINSDQDNSSLTIEVVQPDYLASQAVEYRFHLKGLDQGWSEWSQSNNIIEIPYIPSGDYILQVQSKNIFGEDNTMQELLINVIPPYWKRPWFYALEVLLFSVLVILSFRLSIRYRIVSRLLMLLTIIILIQLVETLIGETLETKTSPVIDFFVQVVIAMLVLPVEGYLRERMLRSLEFKDRFYKFMLPKISKDYDENLIEK